ncbi:MAG: FeoB-associated Cys-rich membrane protein [Verrucomicrobiota bacterium]
MNNPPSDVFSGDLQSIAAIIIVGITLAAFIWRAFRSKKTGCGGGCGCAVKPNQKADSKSPGSL